MPRKLRLEFPGARYHVINRGNYRSDIFGAEGARAAFERCLFETSEKWDWRLHAFVLMSGHFHLGLGTPQANLVRGMQWLEATFANRFNRFRDEQGHVFQGRYRALIIGDDGALGQVCDYIHLNPARANLVPIEALEGYRFSSYWYLHRPEHRPPFLRVETALAEAGGILDNPAGWESYRQRLAAEMAGTLPTSRSYLRLSSGWAIGSDAFRAALIAAHAPIGSVRAWTIHGAHEMLETQWERALQQGLEKLRRTPDEALRDQKSAAWKLALAEWLRLAARARNNWLGQKLNLGSPTVLSRNLSRFRSQLQANDPAWQTLTSTFST
jgi:REP-associated tyrosine transposase